MSGWKNGLPWETNNLLMFLGEGRYGVLLTGEVVGRKGVKAPSVRIAYVGEVVRGEVGTRVSESRVTQVSSTENHPRMRVYQAMSCRESIDEG